MPIPKSKILRTKQRRTTATKWGALEKRLFELSVSWCYGEVINLPGWQTIQYTETAHDVVVLAEVTTEFSDHCICGMPAQHLHGWGSTKPSFVMDVPIRCKRTRIYFRLQRKRCKACNKSFQQPLVGIHDQHAMTSRLVEYIQQESFDIYRTFADVADEVGTSELTIRTIFTAHAKKIEQTRRVETPKWIAIDEVYPSKNSECCVITDPISRRVLDLLPTNKTADLAKWLLQLPDRHCVEIVTMDMWPAYRKIVRKLLPQARIIVDRYHVQNLLNVALKHVLDVVRDSMSNSERRAYMRREELLLKTHHDLSRSREKDRYGKEKLSEKEVVQKWFKDVPDIATAYQLKTDFSDILQLKDRDKADGLIDTWIGQVYDFVKYFRAKYKGNYSGGWMDPFGNVPSTISEWRSNILNYIEYKFHFSLKPTNGFAEWANKQIKKASKLGNRYSYEVLRIKVVHGGVLVKKRPAHPLNDRRPPTKHNKRVKTKEQQEVNPHANVISLKRVREENDETRNLIENPQENAAWLDRFNIESLSEQGLNLREEHAPLKTKKRTRRKQSNQKEKTVERRRRSFKDKRNQLKLF